MRVKVNKRIIDLIDNGVKTKHRSLLVIIGDKSSHQITNLHYLMRRHSGNKCKPSVLWCYKDKLDISSHRKKRAKQLNKLLAQGLLDSDMATAASLFLDSGSIEHHQYKDSEKVLGKTFGMLVLQDVHERYRTASHSVDALMNDFYCHLLHPRHVWFWMMS